MNIILMESGNISQHNNGLDGLGSIPGSQGFSLFHSI
jgi:hypothetical protein